MPNTNNNKLKIWFINLESIIIYLFNFYEEEYESKTADSLLRLAKLNFNLLQMLHRKELCELSRYLYFKLKKIQLMS